MKNKNEGGCCALNYADTDKYNYCVCMGWSGGYEKDEAHPDGYHIVLGVKRQTYNNCMQCDYDIDFEYPYNEETGDCDIVERDFETAPTSMKEWNEIATAIRKEARRLFRDWKNYNDEGGYFL